jgi:putative membrane protein
MSEDSKPEPSDEPEAAPSDDEAGRSELSQPPEAQDIAWGAGPYTTFSGFCMGTADVVPGVSGGTMAVALGIYYQLLAAITSANREALTSLFRLKLAEVFRVIHWRFLTCLVLGVGLGVAVMVKIVKLPSMVLASSPHRPLVYAVFFGMVLGSAIMLGRHVEKWNPVRAAACAAGAAAGFAIVNLVPVATPEHPAFIFLCGSVAICAMLLPGISGSFILLILGKYAYILGAVGKLDLMVLIPFGVGCVVGILLFSRLLKWLLSRWQHTVLAVLIGLLIGSLWRIWPYQHITEIIVREKPRVIGAEPFLPPSLEPKLVLGFVLGILFVMGIEWYAVRRKAAQATTV